MQPNRLFELVRLTYCLLLLMLAACSPSPSPTETPAQPTSTQPSPTAAPTLTATPTQVPAPSTSTGQSALVAFVKDGNVLAWEEASGQSKTIFDSGDVINYPGMVGLTASLNLINGLGPAVIARHILDLTDQLIEGLRRLPVRLVTPPARAHRSGIVTFSLGDVAREAALIERLLDARVMVSHRYTSGVGGVRVSCHFFNAADDVAREAALVERLLDARVMVSHRYTSGVGGVRVSCHFFNAVDDVARLLDVRGGWLTASGSTR